MNKVEIITLIAILVIISLMAIGIYYIKTEGTRCALDPLKYYQDKENTYCSCLNSILVNKDPIN